MTAKRLILYGFLVWVGYVLGRSALQQLLPVTSWNSYLIQDLCITGLRATSAVLCYFIARRRWSRETLGLTRLYVGSGLAWAACVLLMLAAGFGVLSHPVYSDPTASWVVRLVEVGVALIVAANEEIGFRALFYRGLRETWGPAAGIWIPSLFFAAMHYGYQPSFHLTEVFIVGATFAMLRARGASLSSLILLHFLFDTFDAAFAPGEGFVIIPYLISVGLASLALLAAWKAPSLRAWPAKTALLFAYGTLKQGQAPAKAMNMEGRAEYLGVAGVQGRLYQLGDYPGLRSSKKAGELVQGELYALCDPDLLKDLDAYEGDEYLRDRVDLETSNDVWAYYLKSVPRRAKKRFKKR